MDSAASLLVGMTLLLGVTLALLLAWAIGGDSPVVQIEPTGGSTLPSDGRADREGSRASRPA